MAFKFVTIFGKSKKNKRNKLKRSQPRSSKDPIKDAFQMAVELQQGNITLQELMKKRKKK